MALADLRLALMSFPQTWDGATLALNLLCVPSVDPLAVPLAGAAPAFADHAPSLRAVAIPSLDAVPTTADPLAVRVPVTIVAPAAPTAPRPRFLAMAAQATAQGVSIGPPPPPPASPVQRIRKALPASYLAITGISPTGDLTTTTDDFGCAIRGTKPGAITGPPSKKTSWGELISYALRQRVLATALGLRYELTFPLDQKAFAGGGWVFIELDPADPWAAGAVATPGAIRLYAARIPALESSARPLFAAVLFPVDAGGGPADGSAITEAERYDSGFVQIVHAHQPTGNDGVVGDASTLPAPSDIGIQIGWEDEQVVTWNNRQLALLAARRATSLDTETPLGILGYRVDVADVTGLPPGNPASWESLMFVHTALPAGFGTFDGELMIEPGAMRLNDTTTDAWLPHYFANWRGGSLSVADDVPNKLIQKPTPPRVSTPLPISTLLSYGRSYAFRVRLGDLTTGGPLVAHKPVAPGPASVASVTFQRMVPPKSVRAVQNFPGSAPPDSTEPESLTVFRPIIAYPEVLYTHLGDTAADRDTIVQFCLTRAAAIKRGQVAGLPDPDVERVHIRVEVRAPAHDIAGPGGALDGAYRVLYETERAFPALPPSPTPADPGLAIAIAYVDAPSVVDWAPDGWPDTGPLVIPRGRDVHLRFEPLVRDDPAYFGEAGTRGLSSTIAVRAEVRDEPALLIRNEENDEPVRGFLFRRPPDIAAPPVAAQFAQTLRLVDNGLTLSARPGRRVVFAASQAIRHSLSGDAGSITFASESELLRNWIVALVIDLDRDWTWDGLDGPIAVERDGQTVGSIAVSRTLAVEAILDPQSWDRARTLLIFFDAVDPHEKTASGFPEALRHTWVLKPKIATETGPIVGAAGAPTFIPSHVDEPPQTEIAGTDLDITLPIAIPPSQVPELASVGIALSPYVAGDGYASTEPRQRVLWIELKHEIENKLGDALFARVIGHGADPLLYDATPSNFQPDEPPLVLDPELMRVISPHDSDDRAGLDSMTQLEQATDSRVRFLLRLPPDIDPDNPELFGFWTYELRICHAGDPHAPHQMWWSTANGRPGRPLHVNGVQHPAPPLYCRAGRATVPPENIRGLVPVCRTSGVTATGAANGFIEVTASYATPLLDGKPLVTPFDPPKTTLCFLLYAQVIQADGALNRNILLTHCYGTYTPPQRSDRQRALPVTSRDRVGYAVFATADVEQLLFLLGLPVNSPLSVLSVELLPGGVGNDVPKDPAAAPHAPASVTDPLGVELLPAGGRPQRILRVSPLVPVAAIC
jgi:hypothetical protein